MGKKQIISKEEIEHIARLALIDLSEEEKETFSKQLNNILDYFQKLNELDTTNVEPTRHVIDGLKNVFREDIPRKSLSQEEALRNTSQKKDGFFKAPRIIKE
jgi:aspartyl-tRNA(Asn)/glutamyl-tRNA(Gln) amidotransferase subunit C